MSLNIAFAPAMPEPRAAEFGSACPSAPEGVHHVNRALVAAVLADVGRIHTAATVSVVRMTGELLLARFFGGDLDALSRIGRNHASLSALLEHEGLPIRATHLWYALTLLPHLRAIGETLSNKLPLSHHRVLVHIADPSVKRRLAEEGLTMTRKALKTPSRGGERAN